jgi:hypothetical protein
LAAGLQLDFDIQHFHAVLGTVEKDQLFILPKETIVTVVFCVLKPGVIAVNPGKYNVNHKGADIEVNISVVRSAAEDQVLEAGRLMAERGVDSFGCGDVWLPFSAVMDHRGIYPACAITCVFPYRLSDKPNIDYEELAIVGFPPLREKIELISVLRQLCNEHGANSPPLVYESITTFVERYFRKPERVPFAQKVHALASATAFIDALADALGLEPEPVKKLTAKWASARITDEKMLAAVAISALDEVLKFYVEDRHWIEPFWDGGRSYSHEGQEVRIPRLPKNETAIQPTLHVILELSLRPLGIHVVRESDEGIGTLDFRCLYTTPEGEPISVGIEFKLAHHQKLKHGIHVQLPAYLRAIRSRHGIFAVMWFKSDSVMFGEPSAYSKHEMKKWLEDEAIVAGETHGVDLTNVLIDASIRPTASKAAA